MTRPEKPARFADLRNGGNVPSDARWVTPAFLIFVCIAVVVPLVAAYFAQCLSC